MTIKHLLERERMRQHHAAIDKADGWGTGFRTTMRVASDRPSRITPWTAGMSISRPKVTSTPRALPPQRTLPPKPPQAKYSTSDHPSRFDSWVRYAVGLGLKYEGLQRLARKKFVGEQVQEFIEHVTRCQEQVPDVPTYRPSNRPMERPEPTTPVQYTFADSPIPQYHVNPKDVPYWEDTPLLTAGDLLRV